MSEINYQALRDAAEKATKGSYIVGHTSVNQHGNLTGVFVCQKWKGEPGGVIAECHVNCLVETDAQAYANAEFIAAFNPNVALALLDERERNQQYIKSRDKENEDIALTVGKLRVELEAEKQREKDLFMENVRLKSGIAGLIHLGIRYADVEVMKIAGDAQLSTPCTDSIINSIAAGIFTKEGAAR
ncbi:TPA: ead/Ea22-like family protein [Escherichia coli]|nr:ead/Ea22-like family protein [Escherichia coli]EFW8783844.1 ead/Ea22-like family protein [Shigella flexneri]EFX7206565.1 ead/Ea22-like family protein [Shigella sonnei]MIZ41771.1 ead/Ea22-like family protein [Shigella boydii]TLI48329.1 ead/Ea22-like family protein [Escherichia coli O25b:H4]EFI4230918.1 ead/Ea22-like family protein [Escherichia coli]